MSNVEWRPRLTVEVSEEQAFKMQELIPWGLKAQIFSCIINDLIKMIEENGEVFLAAMLSRRIGLSDFLEMRSGEAALKEALAEVEHNHWVQMTQTLAKGDGVSEKLVEMWKKYWMPYKDLPSTGAKAMAREWAGGVIQVIKEVNKTK